MKSKGSLKQLLSSSDPGEAPAPSLNKPIQEILHEARACHRHPKWRNEILDGDWTAPFSDPGFEIAMEKWQKYVVAYRSLDLAKQQLQWLSLTAQEREYLRKGWGINEPAG